MGLDTVELVMAVEEEFSLEIPDSESAKLVRVGDLYRFVLQTLRHRGDVVDEDAIWKRLTDVIVAQLRVQPERVTPDARFIEDFGAD
jgi:acyl carrier protein